ncbi:MAG: HAMP domain-containing protein [Deltaproteobacteria bacterium]|nr:MAG: HAMP domain-containing protein [Deltaproteobacteria bacterium]
MPPAQARPPAPSTSRTTQAEERTRVIGGSSAGSIHVRLAENPGMARASAPSYRVVTHVMRTLSARILVGFVLLTLYFGWFAATIVWNLREVEDEASLILRGYVPLALASANLVQREEDLRGYLDQGLQDASIRTITSWRKKRDQELSKIRTLVPSPGAPVNSDGQAASEVARHMPKTSQQVGELNQLVADTEPFYGALLAALPVRIPAKSDPGFQAAYEALDPPHKRAYDAWQKLRDLERLVSIKVAEIQENSQRRAALTKDRLADNERTILMRAIYLGIGAVLFGLVVSAWLVITLRPLRRLREGARRIAAGDYGKRIPETGPTEIAHLAREFNSMGRAVQEREEEKLRAARLAMVGKMAAQIAHEVRNPLSSIGLNTELLEDELGDSASEARELCRAIHAEVNRLTEVTETYLGLRGGKPKLARESLNAIIDDLVDFVRNDLATRSVSLATELDPDDPTGHVDANQIRQCLINLVRNAADAVSENGGGRVILRTRAERDRVEIEVEDDGVGIADELLPRLFDPFFSTKEGGNGLGLALTQQIISDHGGEIHVASRVGSGTTFTLSVPIA